MKLTLDITKADNSAFSDNFEGTVWLRSDNRFFRKTNGRANRRGRLPSVYDATRAFLKMQSLLKYS